MRSVSNIAAGIFLVLLILVLFVGCTVSGPALARGKPPQMQTCWDGTVIPVDSTCPPKPPAVTDSPLIAQMPPPISSEFDVASELTSAPIPAREEGGEGAFRFAKT